MAWIRLLLDALVRPLKEQPLALRSGLWALGCGEKDWNTYSALESSHCTEILLNRMVRGSLNGVPQGCPK